MSKTKKKGNGGAVLLETKGREYFVELRKKGSDKISKALKLWEKEQKLKKLARSAKAQEK